MTPMDFNNKTSWGVMTDAIIAPKSVEGRQYWSEINNYKLGMTKEKQFGYQYLLGENFPVIFKKQKQEEQKSRTGKKNKMLTGGGQI